MKQEIQDRIIALGGAINPGANLQQSLEGITFQHPLYPKELWGDELYGIDEFHEKHIALYQKDKDAFYQKLLQHFFSDHELPYGQMFHRKRLFTPLTEGTEDFEEWGVDFKDAEMTDLSEIKKVVGDGKLEFMEIAYSYGFPDGYYICLSDPQPENPTVFGTDHEVFFHEITHEGNLATFFQQFYTKEEFLNVIRNYLENEK